MQNPNTQPPASVPPVPAPAATTTGTPAPAQGMMGKIQLSPWLLNKLLILAIVASVGIGAFFWGRHQQAKADISKIGEGDSRNRVVAYLYNDDVVVSREELGEYLIQRFGQERVKFMVNRKIVEMECRKASIVITDREVEERFQKDLGSFGPTRLTEQEFVNSVLRRFGKTLYEWKEDVIRPKLMMEKLVRSTIKITDKDIKQGFEARYGPKVECRMIVCEAANYKHAQTVWENARKGRSAFLEEARKQFIPNLASAEGKVPPIHKYFGDKDIEDAAFRLKEDEVSGLMRMKDGTYVVLMCDKHIPASIAIREEQVRTELADEMFELRVAQRIPEVFAEMERRATPKIVLDNSGTPSFTAQPAPDMGPKVPLVEAPKGPPVEVPPPPMPQPVKGPDGVKPLPDKLAPLVIPPLPMPPVVTPGTGTPMIVPPPAVEKKK